MWVRNWEHNFSSGLPVTGATVEARLASLVSPNTGSVVASTTTDANGMWEFTTLADQAHDIKVISGGNIWWHKGMTKHSVDAIFYVTPVPRADQFLLNGGFEVATALGTGPWTATSADQPVLDGWRAVTGAGSSATVSRDTSIHAADSTTSAKVIYTKVAGSYTQYQSLPTPATYRGKQLSFSIQVRQGVANNVSIRITDNVGTTTSSTSATTGSFVTLTVTRTVDAAATSVAAAIDVAGSDTVYIDNCVANLGASPATYSPEYRYPGAIGTDLLGDLVVTTPKLADLSVTAPKLAAGSVTAPALGAGAATDTVIGTRTPDQTVAATSGALTLTQALSMTVNRLKAIMGTTNWYDAPADTVASLNTRTTTAQNTANTGVTNAATAQSTANTAVTNAATAQTAANNAQSTANTAVSNAATAQGTANTAVSNAATAQGTANTANATANAAVVRAGDTGLGDMTFASSKTLKWPTQDALKMDLSGSGEYQVSTSAGHLVYKTNRYVDFQQYNNSNNSILLDTTLGRISAGPSFTALTVLGQLVVTSDLQVQGNFTVLGSGKGRLAKGYDGHRSLFHANETPTPVFEDFGRTRLTGSLTWVAIPADFANYVNLDDYHVFLTPAGPAALYVDAMTPTGFWVGFLAGDPEVEFFWRVMARQGDATHERKLRTGDDEPYQMPENTQVVA